METQGGSFTRTIFNGIANGQTIGQAASEEASEDHYGHSHLPDKIEQMTRMPINLNIVYELLILFIELFKLFKTVLKLNSKTFLSLGEDRYANCAKVNKLTFKWTAIYTRHRQNLIINFDFGMIEPG